MSARVLITGVSIDRRSHEQKCRGAALTQELADRALEREWRERVRANVARRALKRVGWAIA